MKRFIWPKLALIIDSSMNFTAFLTKKSNICFSGSNVAEERDELFDEISAVNRVEKIIALCMMQFNFALFLLQNVEVDVAEDMEIFRRELGKVHGDMKVIKMYDDALHYQRDPSFVADTVCSCPVWKYSG
jgi:hypothetical protein